MDGMAPWWFSLTLRNHDDSRECHYQKIRGHRLEAIAIRLEMLGGYGVGGHRY